ncbi:hypothetical protein CEXT_557441 [Caerostris extrusa]|uniref:Uncharacterized protein n=1 Tax=Caerostris extrusa TaxID=172846 RepID=A0AAV4T7Q3_CAEEX|nr:hypothetical protein CEXT_557441 [Caerostris extrusa]
MMSFVADVAKAALPRDKLYSKNPVDLTEIKKRLNSMGEKRKNRIPARSYYGRRVVVKEIHGFNFSGRKIPGTFRSRRPLPESCLVRRNVLKREPWQ